MANKAQAIKSLYSHWSTWSTSEYTEVMLDFEKYCAEGKIILNKNGEAGPFILNEAQLAVTELVLPYLFKPIPEPVTLVIHKSRQSGISVVLAALEQYIATRRKNLSLYHLMPTDDLAKDFYEKKAKPLLEGTHPSLLPVVYGTISPNVFLKFKEYGDGVLNSYVRYGGALSKGAGRSGTNHVIVMDEYAFYERVGQLERGLLATQPKTGFVLTIYVSTANGPNHFRDLVNVAKKDDTQIKYLFLPWHMLAEYETEPRGRLKDLTKLNTYELKLAKIFEEEGYPVDKWARKMQWYADTLEKEAKNDPQYMFSEYPSTSQESFEATGDPVLPTSILLDWQEKAMDAPFTYMETVYDHRITGPNKIAFQRAERSTTRMYKKPEPGRRYLIGVDPSMGAESSDYSAGVVLDYESMEEVCTFREKMEQTELAEFVVNLARWYNNAIIIPERNMGNTLIEWIKLQNYPRLYVDPMSTRNRALFGIHMTRPVKSEAIERMRYLMINGIWKTTDKQFIDDSLHFVWKKTPSGEMKKAVASGTDENNRAYHDDTIMARLTLISTLDMRRWKNYGKENDRRRI